MSRISNATENAILNLVFLATAWANYADNAASSPQTNVAFALHSADPGDAGDMSTSEIAYTGYARQNVARSGSGFTTATTGSINLAAPLDFPVGTGGSGTVTYFSSGKTGGGAAAILWSGLFSPSQAVGASIIPRLAAATSISLD